MKKSSFAVAAIAALTVSTAAFAADSDNSSTSSAPQLTMSNGWYFSGSAGLAFMGSTKFHGGGTNYDLSADNPGYDVTGALGKDLGNGFRVEGELGYHDIGIDNAKVYSQGGIGTGSGPAGGDASAVSLMANGYYDINTGTNWKPYVGVGVGMADVSMDAVDVAGHRVMDDSDLAFAYQAMTGIGYQLTPQGTIYTGYRYFAVEDPSLNDEVGGTTHSELTTHNIEVGYRLSF
ncbi:MAG TPA: P44/Msp2 family outer membrane protein [Magnetospirillaceae bacterium]|jgi:opacity protein-like surface antigen